MSGGAIYGCNSYSGGGGVYVLNGGSFTMSGGTIRGNASSTNGGGVYLQNTASFAKTGGTIYGSGEGANSNTIGSGSVTGNAVYWGKTGDIHYRNATLSTGDNLSTTDASTGWLFIPTVSGSIGQIRINGATPSSLTVYVTNNGTSATGSYTIGNYTSTSQNSSWSIQFNSQASETTLYVWLVAYNASYTNRYQRLITTVQVTNQHVLGIDIGNINFTNEDLIP
uniref:Uncharacterized protein n=1 Tax=uncultured bacterium contig00004 TaxID=1181496 RepID=A0A806JXS7_9BACT|nr:hypothetical protein [uncultured bacterium contig00004]